MVWAFLEIGSFYRETLLSTRFNLNVIILINLILFSKEIQKVPIRIVQPGPSYYMGQQLKIMFYKNVWLNQNMAMET